MREPLTATSEATCSRNELREVADKEPAGRQQSRNKSSSWRVPRDCQKNDPTLSEAKAAPKLGDGGRRFGEPKRRDPSPNEGKSYSTAITSFMAFRI